MKTFSVNLEGAKTEIFISNKNSFSSENIKSAASILVTDTNMSENIFVKELSKNCSKTVVIESGEKNKTIKSVETILKAAVMAELDRTSMIIGFGGGVVCDMAAFAASIFMRGCKLVLFPTTLLSMVDASIGGKTGVDFLDRKNIVGSFYPAERVYISTSFLKTLPAKHFKSGLAEILKYAFLSGEDYLNFVEQNKEKILSAESIVLEELIFKSLKVKAGYVEKDFREEGIRAHLNLGHTFGHALEAATDFNLFTHGEAVAWGIAKSAKAGTIAGITDEMYAKRIDTILRSYKYNIDFNGFEYNKFFDALNSDKKKKNGKKRFILQKNIGETDVYQLDEQIVQEAILKTNNYVNVKENENK